MVELFRNICIDFVLFSFIEGFIFTMFFTVVGGCKKFKWCEIGLLSLVNCIVSQTLPPVIYQGIGLIYMGAYIKIRDNMKVKDSIKTVLLASLYMLVLEMTYCIIVGEVININPFYTESKLGNFILLIPVRFIEILPLKIKGVHTKMKSIVNGKWWAGDNVKRK